MDKEEVKIKISVPMFEEGELERFDNYIHEIAKEFTELQLKEKDMILTQRIIAKQEAELDKYKNIVDELKKENEKLHKQVREYQDEIFARDNNWYDMCD